MGLWLSLDCLFIEIKTRNDLDLNGHFSRPAIRFNCIVVYGNQHYIKSSIKSTGFYLPHLLNYLQRYILNAQKAT